MSNNFFSLSIFVIDFYTPADDYLVLWRYAQPASIILADWADLHKNNKTTVE